MIYATTIFDSILLPRQSIHPTMRHQVNMETKESNSIYKPGLLRRYNEHEDSQEMNRQSLSY